MKRVVWKWVGLLLLPSVVHAARLASFCTMGENNSNVSGMNVSERMPLASVSKLFTSLLAVSKNSVEKKLFTQFYFKSVGAGMFDVHIKGAHEPYFNRQAMHWLIAKLNEAGVNRIQNLSFDENFKYYHDTDRAYRVGRQMINPLSGKNDIDAPSPELVRQQLFQTTEVLRFYDKSFREALSNGIHLPSKLVFRPVKIEFVPSEKFNETRYQQKGYVASPDLLNMLKLMNWNSNNHAADQIFQVSGGQKAFAELFYGKLGLTENDVRFVNGSGQNANLEGDGRDYNEATCTTVVKTVRALKKALENQKAKLEDAVAVVGGDIGSTVGGATYTNPLTKLSVIAKTGTVGTNVTLAGMISSQSGNHFFFINSEVRSAPPKLKRKNAWINAEAARARKLISNKLSELIKKLGGPKPIEYKTRFFEMENFDEGTLADDEGT